MAAGGEEIAAPPAPSGPYEDDPNLDRLFERFAAAETEPGHFGIQKIPSPYIYNLRDTQQKVVSLQDNKLVAESAAANVSPAEIEVAPNTVVTHGNHRYPIYLGVKNRCLSCGTSNEPALQLVDRDVYSFYKDKSENKPYTFLSEKTGDSYQFESLAFPGWFLCTSQENKMALSLTKDRGQKQITTFYFKLIRS